MSTKTSKKTGQSGKAAKGQSGSSTSVPANGQSEVVTSVPLTGQSDTVTSVPPTGQSTSSTSVPTTGQRDTVTSVPPTVTSGGHYGITLTISTLSRRLFWLELAEDVGKLVANCLHCLPTQGGQRIPRPLGTQIHGQKPNQVLHFDYVYIYPVKNGASHSHQWIFVVRDDFTGMVMLEPCATPNTSVTVQTLMKWRSLYGSSEFFVSDQGSYFVSEAMKEYCELVRSSHHVTTPYIHYPNGTVEVINKLVLQAFRCLISELRWKKEEWPYLLPTIMHYLNHKPQARLGGRAPIAVMTGMEADNPIEVTFRHLVTTGARTTNVFTVVDSGVVDKYMSDLQDHLQVMHKDVADMTEAQRARHRKAKLRNVKHANFGLGEYVLIARDVVKTGQKLHLTWRGPFHIVELHSHHVYTVEDILTGVRTKVHASRMKFYSDRDLNLTESIKVQKAFDDETFTVESILAARTNAITGQQELHIRWAGFSEAEDSWEPLNVIQEAAPSLVRAFVQQR